MAKKHKQIVIEKGITPLKGDTVLIYTRVSSAKQVREWSWLRSQEEFCRERTWRNEVKVLKVFSDGWVSGKFVSREGLDAMIEYLKNINSKYTKVPFVIIDDIDRIVRDVQGRWEIKAKIENLGWAKIFSLKQKIEDTPEGKMLQSITMSVKQYERENNARRTKDRQRTRMLSWYWCFSPIQGYQFVKDPQGWRILVLVEKDVQIIKEWLELLAEWVILNWGKLRDFYNERGLISRKGNKINNSFIEKLLNKQSLLFYAWYIDFDTWDIKMLKARHPAIISLSTAVKITDRLIHKQLYKTYEETEIAKQLPLRWSLRCECCKHLMTGAPSKSKNGNHYFYYLCRQKGCERYGKSISNNEIHSAFREHLKHMSIDLWTLTLFEKALKNFWEEKDRLKKELNRADNESLQEIEGKVQVLQSRIVVTTNDKLVQLYENQMIDLLDEEETIKYKLSKGEFYSDINIQTLFEETKAILENPITIWNISSLELKRLLTGILFNNEIYYNTKSGIQTPSIPLIYAHFGSYFEGKYLNPGRDRIELPTTVPKTAMLPLHQRPISGFRP